LRDPAGTLNLIAGDKGSTIIFPFPIELGKFLGTFPPGKE